MSHAGAILNIMNINSNGIRSKKKKMFLRNILNDLRAGVRAVTEAHLRTRDLDYKQSRNYNAKAVYCRPAPVRARIGGGVLIWAHVHFAAEKFPRRRKLGATVEHCSF